MQERSAEAEHHLILSSCINLFDKEDSSCQCRNKTFGSFTGFVVGADAWYPEPGRCARHDSRCLVARSGGPDARYPEPGSFARHDSRCLVTRSGAASWRIRTFGRSLRGERSLSSPVCDRRRPWHSTNSISEDDDYATFSGVGFSRHPKHGKRPRSYPASARQTLSERLCRPLSERSQHRPLGQVCFFPLYALNSFSSDTSVDIGFGSLPQ